MNDTQSSPSIEARQIFVDFALAAARVIERPECPPDLAEAINDLANHLADMIGPASPRAVTIALLRGLAQGHTETRATGFELNLAAEAPVLSGDAAVWAEAEKTLTANPGARGNG